MRETVVFIDPATGDALIIARSEPKQAAARDELDGAGVVALVQRYPL